MASRETRSSKLSRDREIEEKMKVAEVIAEAELLKQQQMIQNEAEKLKIKERLAKAKARIQAYNNTELEGREEKEQLQYRNTCNLQDKVKTRDREKLADETTKEELEYGRDQKNITEMMCELLRQQAAPRLVYSSLQGSSGK